MTPRVPRALQGDIVRAGIALALLTLALHGNALNGWWRWDDPQILKHVLTFSPWQYFLIPASWQNASLTPWQSLSFDIDLRLFGLSPSAFYGHLLLVLWVAACMTYMVLRLWLDPLWSGLGAGLFLSGVPVTVVAQELMSRHYFEGLVFAILGLYFFLRAVREGRPNLAWWGGLAYLLAVCTKEVYVPLMLLLPFVPERDFRQRWRPALPFLLVAVGYVPWRWHMLDMPLWVLNDRIAWEAVLRLPFRAVGPLIGKGAVGTTINLLVLGLLGTALWRRWYLLLLTLVALALICGPLVPVAILMDHAARYQLVAWWAFCCMVVLLFEWIGNSGRSAFFSALVLYSLVLGVVFYQGWQVRISLKPQVKEFESQGRFLWDAEKTRALMASPALAGHFWYANGLVWVREKVKGDRQSPRLVVDEIDLVEVDLSQTEVWAYDEHCGCMQNVSKAVPHMLAKWQSRRVVRPLSIAIQFRNHIVSWQFGPYKDGFYRVVNGEQMGEFQVPATGRRIITIPDPSYDFYIRYDSPEGWITYSSLLTFSPAFSPDKEGSLVWERGGY